jgi:hypothetical protein
MEMAHSDSQLVAGALVGSTVDKGDRWSDLDITFSVKDNLNVADVMEDWTMRLQSEFDAVHLFDLPVGPIVYRVFLLPGNLQVDLSFTPQKEFRPRGPDFKLFFGTAHEPQLPVRPSPMHLFGWAVLHVLSARICIERGRFWQAEYLISGARDYILALACLQRGLKTSYGKGFDNLPKEVLTPFTKTLVTSIDRDQLLHALAGTIDELFHNSEQVHEVAMKLGKQLNELKAPTIR